MPSEESGNRQRILDAAISLLDEQRSDPVTVADIAEAASVAPATLYYHFDDRAHLVAEAQAARLMRMFDLIDPPTNATLREIAEGDKDGYAAAVATSRASYWDPANREVLWGYLEAIIEIRRQPAVLERITEPLRQRLAKRVDAVADLQELGWVTDRVDPVEWVLFYFGAVFGQVLWDLVPEMETGGGRSSAVDWVHATIAADGADLAQRDG